LYCALVVAQTEGDTGYDYNDAYEDEFYDESGALYDVWQSAICGLYESYSKETADIVKPFLKVNCVYQLSEVK